MKKKLFSLLTALVLCLLCAVPAFAEMPLVMDTYELFKPEATAELEQKAQDASAGHGVNVYLLTVSDIGGQNVREFAKDWYRDYDLGYGEGKSGILFLIALDSRDYVTITYGGGVTAFTDYRIAQIEDKIVPMLSDGTYYKASETYIEMCADTLDFYAEKGAPLDSGNDPAKGCIQRGHDLPGGVLVQGVKCESGVRFVKILVAVVHQLAKHRPITHIVAVDQPVVGGRIGGERAPLVQKQGAAHGVKAVESTPQVILVVAGGLHHGQVDVGAVDAQPADEIGVLFI